MKYTATKKALFIWQVLNEKGMAVHYGWKHDCKGKAKLFNLIYEAGCLDGAIAAWKEAQQRVNEMVAKELLK